MAAFFSCLTKQRAISTRQSFVYVLFFISDGELGAKNGFLSRLKVCLYVYLNIYETGFPGIKVWNILLNFTMYVDEIICDWKLEYCVDFVNWLSAC